MTISALTEQTLKLFGFEPHPSIRITADRHGKVEHGQNTLKGSFSLFAGNQRETIAYALQWDGKRFAPFDKNQAANVRNKLILAQERLLAAVESIPQPAPAAPAPANAQDCIRVELIEVEDDYLYGGTEGVTFTYRWEIVEGGTVVESGLSVGGRSAVAQRAAYREARRVLLERSESEVQHEA